MNWRRSARWLLMAVAVLAGLAAVLGIGFIALLWWAFQDTDDEPTKPSESAACALLSVQELEDVVGGTASFVDDVRGSNQCGYLIDGSDLGYDATLWTHADPMQDGLVDISIKRIKGFLVEGDAEFVEGVGGIAAFHQDGSLIFFDNGIEYKVEILGDWEARERPAEAEASTALAKVMLGHA